MSTGVMVADWIKRIADDERKRDELRIQAEELTARRARLVHLNGQRLLDELRTTVMRDLEAFKDEFAGARARDIVFEAREPEGGFAIHQPASPAVSLTVSPDLAASAIGCHYRFTSTNGLPPREERLELCFVGDGEERLKLKHQGTGQVFSTGAALSEFLLVPVFTGRPR